MGVIERVSVGAVFVTIVVLGGLVGKGSNVKEVLVRNGLPEGLLPATVKSYTLSLDGTFKVKLKSKCGTKFGSEEVRYKKSITGTLSYRKIENLTGIEANEFFWVAISSIWIDPLSTKKVYFKVGYLSKSLSVDLFRKAPTCTTYFGSDGEEDKNGMMLSEWLSKALNGTLEVNVPENPEDSFGPARRLLQ